MNKSVRLQAKNFVSLDLEFMARKRPSMLF